MRWDDMEARIESPQHALFTERHLQNVRLADRVRHAGVDSERARLRTLSRSSFTCEAWRTQRRADVMVIFNLVKPGEGAGVPLAGN